LQRTAAEWLRSKGLRRISLGRCCVISARRETAIALQNQPGRCPVTPLPEKWNRPRGRLGRCPAIRRPLGSAKSWRLVLGCRTNQERRSFFTLLAGTCFGRETWRLPLPTISCHLKVMQRKPSRKIHGTQCAPLGLCPGWRNRQPRRKRLKRPLCDKDVSVQIRPPDATFLACTNT